MILLAAEVLDGRAGPAELRCHRHRGEAQRLRSPAPVLRVRPPGRGLDGPPLHAVFIRAPVVERVGPQVEVLASVELGGEEHPVVCRQGNVLVASFHPELAGEGQAPCPAPRGGAGPLRCPRATSRHSRWRSTSGRAARSKPSGPSSSTSSRRRGVASVSPLSEVGDQDRWQASTIGFAVVAPVAGAGRGAARRRGALRLVPSRAERHLDAEGLAGARRVAVRLRARGRGDGSGPVGHRNAGAPLART